MPVLLLRTPPGTSSSDWRMTPGVASKGGCSSTSSRPGLCLPELALTLTRNQRTGPGDVLLGSPLTNTPSLPCKSASTCYVTNSFFSAAQHRPATTAGFSDGARHSPRKQHQDHTSSKGTGTAEDRPSRKTLSDWSQRQGVLSGRRRDASMNREGPRVLTGPT